MTVLQRVIVSPNEFPGFSDSLLNATILRMQSDPITAAPIFVSGLFPSVLSALELDPFGRSESASTSIYEALLLQFVFYTYTVVSEVHKPAYIALLLPPLCAFLSKSLQAYNTGSSQGNSQESPLTAIVTAGKGLTHIARRIPGVFKEQIGVLSESDRMTLQSTMSLSMTYADQSNPPRSTEGGTSSGSGLADGNVDASASYGKGGSVAVKKIDISKYRK